MFHVSLCFVMFLFVFHVCGWLFHVCFMCLNRAIAYAMATEWERNRGGRAGTGVQGATHCVSCVTGSCDVCFMRVTCIWLICSCVLHEEIGGSRAGKGLHCVSCVTVCFMCLLCVSCMRIVFFFFNCVLFVYWGSRAWKGLQGATHHCVSCVTVFCLVFYVWYVNRF